MYFVSNSLAGKSRSYLYECIFSENYFLMLPLVYYYKQRGKGKFHAITMDTVEFPT